MRIQDLDHWEEFLDRFLLSWRVLDPGLHASISIEPAEYDGDNPPRLYVVLSLRPKPDIKVEMSCCITREREEDGVYDVEQAKDTFETVDAAARFVADYLMVARNIKF